MDIVREIDRLNDRQKEAVLHTDGPLLVLAGAGSGKTRVITTRVAYIISTGIKAGSVLAVTFTNKAAREMKERALAMIGKTRNDAPIISTFHSLCLSILRREIEHLGYSKDFSIYDTSEQLSLVRNIMSDIQFRDRSFKVDALLDKISKRKSDPGYGDNNDISNDDDIELAADLLFPKYHEALISLNALDFDDLLLLTTTLFRKFPDILERYQDRFHSMMVDEYQDTNKLQYDLIRLLSGEKRNICAVGDDDQSIYGWRGAHPGNILDFEKDFPGTKIVRLEQNYRSLGNILEAANGVIRNNKKRMEKALWTERGKGPMICVRNADDADEEALWITKQISLIRYEKRLAYEDFAVIYRANVLSRPFEEALRRERIPYTVIGGTSYFEKKEIRDLASYLKIMANKSDTMSLLRAANTPKRGLGPVAIGSLSRFADGNNITLFKALSRAAEIEDLAERTKTGAVEFAGLIERYRKRFTSDIDMAGTLRDLIDEIGYKDYIQGLYKTPEAGLRRIENLDAFIHSLEYYEKIEAGPTFQGFLESLALTDFLNEKEERSGGGVTLISLHSAKGLEFPVVFIAGAEEGVLPHRKSVDDNGGIEEERRLFYVGMTRAMKKLHITYTNHRIKYGKETPSTPSRFIEEIPRDIISTNGDEDPENAEISEEDAAQAFFTNIRNILDTSS